MSKITMTAGEIEQLGMALGGIISKDDIPFRISYALAKLTKEVERELKILVEIRQKLVKTHALHDDKGKVQTDKDLVTKQEVYKFATDQAKEAYMKELSDLLIMKVEIEYVAVPVDEMKNVNKFSPLQLKTLMFMFEEPKSPESK